MIYWSLRRDKLCEGPHTCPYASALCECGHLRPVTDPINPGACPSCGSGNSTRIPCEKGPSDKPCPALGLDQAYAESPDGHLLIKVAAIEAAISMQLHVSLGDIPADIFEVMRLIQLERGRLQKEEDQKRGH